MFEKGYDKLIIHVDILFTKPNAQADVKTHSFGNVFKIHNIGQSMFIWMLNLGGNSWQTFEECLKMDIESSFITFCKDQVAQTSEQINIL